MKLIKPSFKIIDPKILNGLAILNQIESVARTCYKSEKHKTVGSSATLIRKLITALPPHEAMLEFGPSITVKFICDRGISHELVRHRLCSFAQESTRYCNYSKDKFNNELTFIIPNWVNEKEVKMWTEANDKDPINIATGLGIWLTTLQDIEKRYLLLVNYLHWSPQQARSILPNSLKTEVNVKANIREWRHIFKLRTSKKAHPQMRELMCPLLNKFKEKIPILFEDINYES